MSKIKAVIVEDEPRSLQLLKNLLVAGGKADVAGETTDPKMAVELIINVNPDMVFLDIHMPGMSGFQILDVLNSMKKVHPYIVFITAYDEFAIKAFEYAAFDYLLKPVEPARLNDTISRCLESMKSGNSQSANALLESLKKLSFRNSSGIIFIDPREIICIEASGNYSTFHLSGSKKETVTMLLGKIQKRLDENKFFRISRSYIINLNCLKKINSRKLRCVLADNDKEIQCEISRDRITDLLVKMK
ncbi:MAG: LytR/AlgR family response regulator transcription factor [Methanosarcina sp.]